MKELKENIKKTLPEWYKDRTNKYHTILTDDLDSLLSCTILEHEMGWSIEEIFLFKKGKNEQDIKGKTMNVTLSEEIGVDLALHKGKCFDNHITRFSKNDYKNIESINPNLIRNITRDNYTSKYAGSTVLLLWSLYDLQKEELTDEAMMILLAIDSAYLGYYSDKYRRYVKYYLTDVLDLPEFYRCITRHTEQEFEDIQDKYRMKEKITLEKNYVTTNIDIDGINDVLLWDTSTNLEIKLPESYFYEETYYRDVVQHLDYRKRIKTYDEIIKQEPYCYALTKTNLLNYSVKIEENEVA